MSGGDAGTLDTRDRHLVADAQTSQRSAQRVGGQRRGLHDPAVMHSQVVGDLGAGGRIDGLDSAGRLCRVGGESGSGQHGGRACSDHQLAHFLSSSLLRRLRKIP